ncbi:AAA family ATPase [Sulfitobacter dubius]|uniref:AAA family ATPase n=1 Tax=Sulfitobacter dubius TaxID=218673 RepID=UPI0029422CFF|nr:AAA family ATPase [Sulfitobacter dubius]WOI29355.1 AAA family ATPase [Sulfitobacter dubius]
MSYQDAVSRYFSGDDTAVGDIPPPAPTPKPEPYAGTKTGKSETATSEFKFVAVGDLEYRPPVFLIKDLIETDTMGLLFGDPGCGKSFLAVDISLSVATGTPYHGAEVQPGAVFYIAGEGHNGLARRFAAWSRDRGVPLKDAPLYKSERAAQFLDGASAKAVAQSVDALAETCGPPALIVVDTLARNFGAGDENSTQDMSAFIVAMDDLQACYPNSVVLIVHHSGHGDKQRARGAMALKGALDFEYRLENKDGTRTLVNTKMKDAEAPADLHFTLQSVDLEDGASSAVMVPANAPTQGKRLGKNASRGLKAFHAAAEKYGALHDDGSQGIEREKWKECFAADYEGEASGVNSQFSQAIAALKKSGLIIQNNSLFQLSAAGGAGE